ncbi:hypothetical protein BS47DRAFT_1394458 [Hydnum rufescens UP504]|uniref:HNH nuclease domain-containing protein n=1 Tax=Hydnum rufescens UP504 TaxID=1448309 RepID=A0A9P6DV01_9AGAM|nr:hypothetical protein BS47DRAFT_1394458 [Hydnum rufescens UP504]
MRAADNPIHPHSHICRPHAPRSAKQLLRNLSHNYASRDKWFDRRAMDADSLARDYDPVSPCQTVPRVGQIGSSVPPNPTAFSSKDNQGRTHYCGHIGRGLFGHVMWRWFQSPRRPTITHRQPNVVYEGDLISTTTAALTPNLSPKDKLMTLQPEVKLWLCLGDDSKLALSIPLAECGRYARYPLKWLRYLGYAIYGAEGYLSTSSSGADINDYTANVDAISYYLISAGKLESSSQRHLLSFLTFSAEPRLVDVDAMDGRTSGVSEVVQSPSRFRRAVKRRDRTCVLTGEPACNSIACHVLPHSKGNNYISNYVEFRGGPDDINSIDDPEMDFLAFLKTPNFGLTVDDIPFNPPQTADQGSPASRLTLQHFVSNMGIVIPLVAPHNCDARLPGSPGKWPPNVILDSVYAAVALQAWGPKSFLTETREAMKGTYYQSAGDDSEDDGEDSEVLSTSGQPIQGNNLRRRNKARPAPRAGRRGETRLGYMLDVVLGVWMHTAKQVQRESPSASNAARDEDIKTWVQSVEESVGHA